MLARRRCGSNRLSVARPKTRGPLLGRPACPNVSTASRAQRPAGGGGCGCAAAGCPLACHTRHTRHIQPGHLATVVRSKRLAPAVLAALRVVLVRLMSCPAWAIRRVSAMTLAPMTFRSLRAAKATAAPVRRPPRRRPPSGSQGPVESEAVSATIQSCPHLGWGSRGAWHLEHFLGNSNTPVVPGMLLEGTSPQRGQR